MISRSVAAWHHVTRFVFLIFVCLALSSIFPLEALAQNTPPVVQVNAGLTLDEGTSATIGPSLLLVTDAEQGADSLKYTVETGPTNGVLSSSTFTQDDIDNYLISYTHDGSETTIDYFTFSVIDGAGGTISSTPFVISVTPVSDAPILSVNNGLTLNEGSYATICAGALQVTDVDNSPSELTYTVTSTPGADGELTLSGSPLTVSSTFTQADVDACLLSYSHNGDDPVLDDAFSFNFHDGETTIPGNTFTITVQPVNDSPVLTVNNVLTLDEGGSALIDSGLLEVTDADNTIGQLTYTVLSGPANGLLSMTIFTQAQINSGSLSYTHDESETGSDHFTFSVNDGVGGSVQATFVISITPANDDPVLAVNNGLTLNEGSSAPIGSGLLEVTDAEQTAAQLTYTVISGPTSGVLSPGTFTQDDINNDLVSYTHDGSETVSDDFTFSVSDGVGGTVQSTFVISITPLNESPVLAVNNGLTLNEGTIATICTSALQVTDVDNTPDELTYIVTGIPGNGVLTLCGSPLTVSSTFTQADVDACFLSYAHDGGETLSDAFAFDFNDGETTIPGNTFAISIQSVNDSPVLTVNNGLTLDEGSSAPIGSGLLEVTDAEQTAAQLTYTVIPGPTSGILSLTTFTQAQINSGSLSYAHNGSETVSDDFSFSVSDGVGGTVQATFVITVTPADDPPTLTGSNSLSVARGGTETITRGQLVADDPDTPSTGLLYTVTSPPSVGSLVLDGSPDPSTFTQDDIDYGRLKYDHSGSSSTMDEFSFTVSDQTTTTGSYIFSITVLGPSADPPVISSIVDVGNDQGRSVLITFQKCGADTSGSLTPVLEYGAFRRIDPLSSAGFETANYMPSFEGWVFVGSVPANGESIYNIVAPTLADSTVGGGIHWSVFIIRALTAEPATYFDSAPDSGYSIDNLAPSIPLNLAYSVPGILTWDDVPDADFDFYTIYGSSSDIFDETAEVLGYEIEPTFDVQVHTHVHFFVTATDFSGNEGGPASIANPTGVDGPPRVLEVSVSAYPNPFNPTTTILYTVKDVGPVTVAVYDAAGKLVETLLYNEYREPNEYRLEYRPRGASGVYFVRLETGRMVRNTKIILLK
ncbi:MAG: tandem-95 repeat protein [bacterium]|nr:MAG: tandem-95 repeat protein [bacterium]